MNKYGRGFLFWTNCDNNPLDIAAIMLHKLRRHGVFMPRNVEMYFFLLHELIWIQFSYGGIPFVRGLINCMPNT